MKKILFSLFLIFSIFGLRAQNNFWEEAKSPYGGGFFLEKTSNDILYAINYTLLKETYRSTDGGSTWQPLTFLHLSFPDAKGKMVQVGAAGTVFLYVSMNNQNGIWYRTNDDGQSWTPMDSSVTNFVETPSGILIGVQSGNLVRSTDGGQTWTNSLDHNRTLSVKNDPFAGIIATYTPEAPDTSSFVFRSPDDGLSWDTIPIPFNYNDCFFSVSGTIFCTKEQVLYRSEDNGITFQATNLSNIAYITTNSLLNGRILLNSSFHDYYSDDDGINWQIPEPTTDGFFGLYYQVAPLANGKIFRSNDYGIYASTDGLTWQFSGTGLHPVEVEEFKFVTDSLYYASTIVGIWRTEDAGETWTLLSQNSSRQDGKHYFEVTSTGGVVLVQHDQLLWSANGSSGFINITPPDSLYPYANNIFRNPVNDHFFVNTKLGLERSQNMGQSWELVSNAPRLFTMVFHPSGRIIAMSDEPKVYFSDNGGSNWQPLIVQNIGAFYPLKVAPDGDIYAYSKSNSVDYLWKSSDVGATWTRLPAKLNGIDWNFASFDIAANGHLYLSDNNKKIFLSSNEGLTWQTLPNPFIKPNHGGLGHIAISPNQHLYASSYFYGLFKSSSPVSNGAYIEGNIRLDADADCSTPDAQAPVQNRVLTAHGVNFDFATNTDSAGHYVFFVDTGSYKVIVQNPNSIWWDYCQDTMSVNLPQLFATDTADFVALPLSYCPLMTVDVGIPKLRRCFDNEVYVSYCNQGTEPADGAWVDIMLDPYLSLVNSAQPYQDLGGNVIRFFVGDMSSGECDQFQLTINVNCDSTILGQTHCITAHGFPDTLCTTLQSWSGANIEASVNCQDSILQFQLENTGSGQSEILNYIIFEDDIVLFTGQEDYDITENLVIDVPANGKTWRIESEQEPGHPFSNLALAFAEGCGGFNSLGYINQFPVNGIQPAWHTTCVENKGSYDPNDKQGFPTGTGDDHNIRPGQTIDYLIRFQNTGTDTAFTVEIRDTLSVFLDPTSIRPGASSHPYTWNLSGQGVISFTFNNIMLPDSNVNEPRSHGFVQFSIAPYLDVPLGNVIENSAAIYFDFNEPVITNTTWHTIQKSPLTSSSRPEPKKTSAGLTVWPNPFSERTNIHVEKKTSGTLLLNIYDSRGKLLVQKTVIGPDIELHAKDLPTGLYWAEVRDSQGKLVGNGKLVKE